MSLKGVTPKIACPVCGFRLPVNWLVRVVYCRPDPLIFMRPRGYGRGWSTVYRMRSWSEVVSWLGDDPRLIFAVKMLNVLKEWIAEGVLGQDFVLSALGMKFTYSSPDGFYLIRNREFADFDVMRFSNIKQRFLFTLSSLSPALFVNRSSEVVSFENETKSFEFKS